MFLMIKIVSQLSAGFGSLVERFTPCQPERNRKGAYCLYRLLSAMADQRSALSIAN